MTRQELSLPADRRCRGLGAPEKSRAAFHVVVVATLLLAGCAGRSHKCAPWKPSDPSGPPIALGFLWEATAPGKQIVLLGTHRLAGPDDIPKRAWLLLAGSNIFVAEVDESDIGDRYHPRSSWSKSLYYSRTRSVRNLVSATDTFELENILRYTPIEASESGARPPRAFAAGLKPWVAMLLLERRAFRFPAPTLNAALLDAVRKNGVQLRFLDSWHEQMRFLDQSVSRKRLSHSIRAGSRLSCELRDERYAYIWGDHAAILATKTSADRAIALRIAIWMPALHEYAASHGRVFVTVPASHLGGATGLLERLRASGYEVRRR